MSAFLEIATPLIAARPALLHDELIRNFHRNWIVVEAALLAADAEGVL
jgi:hypothetical protein